MPDDTPGEGVKQEGVTESPEGETVHPPPPPHNPPALAAQPVGGQPNNTEIQSLKDEVRVAEKWMIWLTGAIAFFGLCTIGVGILQLLVMSCPLAEMENCGVD